MKLRNIIFGLIVLILSMTGVANAAQWQFDVENDPFTDGQKVTGWLSPDDFSAIFLLCDTSDVGLTLRVIAGWTRDRAKNEGAASVRVAFDGTVFPVTFQGREGTYGDMNAGVDVFIDPISAYRFSEAMVEVKDQIAIEDGISNSPHFLTAYGSTAVARAIIDCLSRQKNRYEITREKVANFGEVVMSFVFNDDSVTIVMNADGLSGEGHLAVIERLKSRIDEKLPTGVCESLTTFFQVGAKVFYSIEWEGGAQSVRREVKSKECVSGP